MLLAFQWGGIITIYYPKVVWRPQALWYQNRLRPPDFCRRVCGVGASVQSLTTTMPVSVDHPVAKYNTGIHLWDFQMHCYSTECAIFILWNMYLTTPYTPTIRFKPSVFYNFNGVYGTEYNSHPITKKNNTASTRYLTVSFSQITHDRHP